MHCISHSSILTLFPVLRRCAVRCVDGPFEVYCLFSISPSLLFLLFQASHNLSPSFTSPSTLAHTANQIQVLSSDTTSKPVSTPSYTEATQQLLPLHTSHSLLILLIVFVPSSLDESVVLVCAIILIICLKFMPHQPLSYLNIYYSFLAFKRHILNNLISIL